MIILNISINREGSEHDLCNIDYSFHALNYEIEKWLNCTEVELKDRIKNLKKILLKGCHKSLIFFVMAHGNDREISLKEGKISIDEFMNLFDETSFKEFVNYPKIFFFQACKLFTQREDNDLFINVKNSKKNLIAVFPALKGNIKNFNCSLLN